VHSACSDVEFRNKAHWSSLVAALYLLAVSFLAYIGIMLLRLTFENSRPCVFKCTELVYIYIPVK
jgi:uncharacterized membrane protein